MNKLWLERLKEPKVKPLPEDRGESLVSKVGYINNQRRIEAMLREGMQLRQFRMNIENNEEANISKDIMNNVDDIENVSLGRYMDKVDSIDAMKAQLDDLMLKYKKAQENALEARQKATEAASMKVAEEEKRFEDRVSKILDSRTVKE